MTLDTYTQLFDDELRGVAERFAPRPVARQAPSQTQAEVVDLKKRRTTMKCWSRLLHRNARDAFGDSNSRPTHHEPIQICRGPAHNNPLPGRDRSGAPAASRS